MYTIEVIMLVIMFTFRFIMFMFGYYIPEWTLLSGVTVALTPHALFNQHSQYLFFLVLLSKYRYPETCMYVTVPFCIYSATGFSLVHILI